MALLGLLVEPGTARADKRLEDLVFEADQARATATHLLDEERYAEAIPSADQEVVARDKILTLLKGPLPKQHTPATPSPEELLAQALDHLSRALIESGDYTRPQALLARAAEIHKRLVAK